MREYSPKRRTAVVFTGSGTTGAYHAGVLKALDESGVKIDLVVGSGVGAVAAAFSAVAGGGKLHGAAGFWDDVSWGSFYRLRPVLRLSLLLLGAAFGVFLLPVVLALLAGLLFPLVFIADLVVPGLLARLVADFGLTPLLLRTPYLAAIAAPVFVLSILVVLFLARAVLRDRRRLAEVFESPFDAERGRDRLLQRLWEVVRGPAFATRPSEAELSRRYVALLSENLGQPGFRELVLRCADLETGGCLPFVLLQDAHRAAFAASRARGLRPRGDGIPGAVDLRAPDFDVLLFPAVLTALLPPIAAPVRRVAFPRGGLHGGETHRLADASLVAGCGVSEALAAGAEQVIVVTGTPEAPRQPSRRRGPRAVADGVLATLERQAVETDLGNAERLNRMIEALGQRTPDGGREWQDPATGRAYRGVALYLVRPERRALGPLELDGAVDPGTEVLETPKDLLERGYRDAYRMFVEPVVGASPVPPPPAAEREEGQPVEL